MRGDSREIAGRFGGVNFLLGRPSVVEVTVEAALVCMGFLGVDLGGRSTDDSGVDAEETVKALSDMVNDLGGSWRKGSIPCCSIQ